MATASLEAKALGEKQQNYASSSGSESEEPPSNVARPVRDGLPQVRIRLLCNIIIVSGSCTRTLKPETCASNYHF